MTRSVRADSGCHGLLHSLPVKDFYETSVRVRYAETDRMGVVYYANFFVWFEVGRVELCREMGFAYKQMELEDDSYIVVAEAHCRYHRPAYFDDELRIRTRVTEARSRTIRFGYEVRREASGELLATGETVHVICDAKGRPKALPAKYRKYFPPTPGERAGAARSA
jgi:acyl-CoA thioester hydrolase